MKMKRTKYVNPTPKQAVLKFCRECVPKYNDRKNCQGDKLLIGSSCFLYPYRMGKGRPSVKIIRKHCLQCMGGSSVTVKECPSINCPLFPFRFGTNPNRERKKSSLKS